eukprot:694594-Rhodomonas_salina.1
MTLEVFMGVGAIQRGMFFSLAAVALAVWGVESAGLSFMRSEAAVKRQCVMRNNSSSHSWRCCKAAMRNASS